MITMTLYTRRVGAVAAIVGAVLMVVLPDRGFGSLEFSVAPLIVMPVAYAVMGYLMAAVWIIVYNAAAKSFGGIELEFSPAGEVTKSSDSPDIRR